MRRIIEPSLPTLALVGRVNVGKSTLFNRLIGESRALVSPTPGTTRTRNLGIGWWRGEQFRVIDTGGLTFDETLPFEKEVVRQMEIASKEANLVLFLADVTDGVLPQERELAARLRNAKLSVLLVVNKSDSPRKAASAYDPEWRRLGFGDPIPVSAVTGFGVGDMLDAALTRIATDLEDACLPVGRDSHGCTDAEQTPPPFPPLTKGGIKGGSETEDLPPEPIKVAIVGRPNVGKSTLFNQIIGEERVIVSPVAHTTREAHDTLIEVDGTQYLFIDTAGIRKKARVDAGLERVSVAQAFRTIDQADVALLLLDASESLGHQDKALARRIADKGKGCIIVVNKWDMFKRIANFKLQNANLDHGAAVEEYVRGELSFIDYAPILRTSALTGEKVPALFSLIDRIAEARKKQITDEECEAFLRWVVAKKLPVRGKGVRHPKLLRMKQIAAIPPTFEVAIKVKTSVANAYLDFLARMLREKFDFFGTPVVVYVRKAKKI